MSRHLASNKHRGFNAGENQGIPPLLFYPVTSCKRAEKGFSRADHLRRHIRSRHKDASGLLGSEVDESRMVSGASSGDVGEREGIGDAGS